MYYYIIITIIISYTYILLYKNLYYSTSQKLDLMVLIPMQVEQELFFRYSLLINAVIWSFFSYKYIMWMAFS
jgi:hypothetical protein